MGVTRTKSPPLKLRLAYLLAAGFSEIARVVPVRLGYAICDRVGDLLFHLFPTYRDNVAANIAQVTDEDVASPRVRQITRNIFRNSARNFYDLLNVPHISVDELRASVNATPETWAYLDEALASGRGGLILSAHFGAFEHMGQVLWANGYRLTPLTTRTVPEFVYAFVTYLRAARGLKSEEATPGGVRRIVTALRRGQFVALLSDRDFFQNGIPVTFFDRETTLPPGPARIARDTGAPIVPIFTRRLRSGYQLVMEPPFRVEKTADMEGDVRRAVQRIVAIFERHIRESPDQWVMFQRVWPDRPAAPLRVFPVGSPLEGEIMSRGAHPEQPLTEPAGPEEGRAGRETCPVASDQPARSRASDS